MEMTQSEPINIFSDNNYSTQVYKILRFAKLKSKKNSISKAIQTIQDLLQSREHPWQICPHQIRSHTELPGMLAHRQPQSRPTSYGYDGLCCNRLGSSITNFICPLKICTSFYLVYPCSAVNI